MTTNKTPNYQLHSWTSTDHFRFHEVNENFTLLDAALKREADTLAAALEPRLRVCVGSYTGSSASNHTLSQRIALGFRPKALLFGFDRGFLDDVSNCYGGLATPARDLYGAVILDDAGFTVVNVSDHRVYPNVKGFVYSFLAFS